MQYQSFLIKYAEIGVKGKNRSDFEVKLVDQIKIALRRCEGKFAVSRKSGRMFVDAEGEYDYGEVTGALQRVFGIAGVCPMKVLPVVPYPELSAAVGDFFGEEYPERSVSFKVVARRLDKSYEMNSQELDAALGGDLLQRYPSLRVDVHRPEVTVHVEIRDRIYVYTRVLPGQGGLPVGSAGKAMLLLSGGIDSPVAGWMMGKRGLKLDAVYFNAPPYTSERALQKVIDIAKIVARYTGTIVLHNINFTEIQLYIYEKCPHDELTIIMRRYMMRLAEKIAARTDCGALITGESLGQVASQTLRSLECTNAVCRLPVFRPLIGFDKEEIVAISKKIDSYETSILPYEDCCTIFVAKHPVTKPISDVIERHEHQLDEKIDEMMERALGTDEIIIVTESGHRILKAREDDLKPGY
ncbi:tRNA uracil 4-sulfurtransferase ThiI [Lachnoclostridium sp. Marseille-P6806]|uniref:tRNA uracil 4-sulfurtransferase ThiI n=1 Tax=Lachnoclostridium sp. Marseille-P6806 TaxID=2364793 RepID=UPI001031325F|nr:tRNA uracil 4-sulfurtransferase ThiI [Lachnoclostridium sp. Marseille-P6806]